ncbi:hypothetical protein JL721_11874 [Aureococcus anophagefferens]|nr:hypothetical protein JL721_11874 [Aureococcus anophagefferens]
MFLVAEAYALRAGPARLARRRLGALRPLASAPPAAAEWTVPRVRDTFVDYFAEKRGHTRVPSSGVVPLQDPTLLFANAGMNQFKPIFLGQAAPGTQLATLERACNSQKCIRAGGKHNDLEDVGLDTYHHTFFEMLGSWSFGDYFKAEATAWAKELLVDVYGLDMDRMYATYFEGSPEEGLEPDYEARDLWLAEGFKPEQFERDGKTKQLSSLPAQHVDTGLGLERLVAILNQVPSNYDTDAFSGLFAATLAELPEGSAPYGGLLGDDDKAQNYRDTAYRAIADHVRCLSFAIADGARPSNEGRGYVLRRILRRAVRYGLSTLGAEPGFMARLAPALAASHFGDYYPELRDELPTIAEVLAEEEATFAKTLERGVKYDEELDKLEATDVLGGDAAFFLYDSPLPVDLTGADGRGAGFVDEPGFEAAMRAQASDRGSLVLGGASVDVIDVQAYAGYAVHTSRLAPTPLLAGDAADGVVDGDARRKHAVNHMMTHAVNHALWAELGDGAAFAGAPTIADVLASPDDEKWDKASIELCGGNHLGDAAAAEYFVITQETAVAKGVRRIEALTGAAALEAWPPARGSSARPLSRRGWAPTAPSLLRRRRRYA